MLLSSSFSLLSSLSLSSSSSSSSLSLSLCLLLLHLHVLFLFLLDPSSSVPPPLPPPLPSSLRPWHPSSFGTGGHQGQAYKMSDTPSYSGGPCQEAPCFPPGHLGFIGFRWFYHGKRRVPRPKIDRLPGGSGLGFLRRVSCGRAFTVRNTGLNRVVLG